MDGDQQLAGRGRVVDRMHARVLPGEHLAAAQSCLVLQIRVAVGGQLVTAFDRLALHDLHGANGAGMVVRHAALTGKPGHHQQIVGFPHHHRNAIVVPRSGLNIGRHVRWSELDSLQGVAQVGQSGILAQTIQFIDQIEKTTIHGSHEGPHLVPGWLRLGRRCYRPFSWVGTAIVPGDAFLGQDRVEAAGRQPSGEPQPEGWRPAASTCG